MLRKIFMRINGDERGITGLETAIILIAFVVVASVFAYTVLSAGLFSSQKSQDAVYDGLSEARSALALMGSISGHNPTDLYLYGEVPAAGAKATNTGSALTRIDFVLGLAPNSKPIDLAPYYGFDSDGALQVDPPALPIDC